LSGLDDAVRVRDVQVEALPPRLRMRLFCEREGVSNQWLWLNRDGTPHPNNAWYKTFDRANAVIRHDNYDV
jgi:hypothetical protein